MAFFTVKADAESVRDGGNGSSSYINKSGMYEVIIKHVIVDQTKNGSQVLHLWLEYAGKEQPIYNAIRLTNNDGTANFGQDLFNKLCVVMGAANGGEISDPIPAQVPMGKGGVRYDDYAGVAMECQNFPDAPNKPHFPSAILRKGERYECHIVYEFGVE